MQTQKEALLSLFRHNGNKLTLGQLLQPPLAAAYRGRISDLRRDGYKVEVVRHPERPSENVYVLHEREKFVFEENGQRLIT